MRGLEFAINDIGLAIFTAISPAGALAFVAMACLLMLGKLSDEQRLRFEGWLIIPLALTLIGLVASTAHLGTPSNALYVLNRVGVSPLSTEVVIAVVFLGVGCTYWYSTIYFKTFNLFKRIWLAVAAILGLVFIWGTTQAYIYETVLSWTRTFAWTNITLTALGAFPPITVLMMVVTGLDNRRGLVKALCVIGVAGTLASAAMMFVVNSQLCALYNAYGCAGELVPHFVPVLVAYGTACAAANIGACLSALRHDSLHSGTVTAKSEHIALFIQVLWCLLVLVAAFAVRFEFYCMHMTAGVV